MQTRETFWGSIAREIRMSALSIKIEELLKEIENCELVAGLATEP
jgi:hypothetical protein